MSDNAPRVAQACPLRNIVIPDSVHFQAVDDTSEQDVGHEFRELRRKELGIPEDRSILHPDQLKLSLRGPAQPVPPAVGQQPQQPQQPVPPSASKPKVVLPGVLGLGLEKLVGSFEGNGFNQILRPQNGMDGQGMSEVLLELNLTYETLSFLDSTILGDVPNRGFNNQPDVNLRGLPYTQIVKDITNESTGLANKPIDKDSTIHWEQGLLMRTPALTKFRSSAFTDTEQILPSTITRMASIPHGTTINAQCIEPTAKIAGAPVFKPGALATKIILPFNLGQDPLKSAITGSFDQLEYNKDVLHDRIPLNFPAFRREKTITEAQFNNPNVYLKENNDQKTIIEHVTFTVDTQRDLALWGGGTNNIAQLAEREELPQVNSTTFIPQVNPISKQSSNTHIASIPGKEGIRSTANANAVRVTCQYWISTVEDVINVPVYDKATLPRDSTKKDEPDNIMWLTASPEAVKGIRKPSFKIMLDKVEKAFKAKVRYTQIQYSQNVTLDFGFLSWPHISVATLVPKDPVPITSKAMLQEIL